MISLCTLAAACSKWVRGCVLCDNRLFFAERTSTSPYQHAVIQTFPLPLLPIAIGKRYQKVSCYLLTRRVYATFFVLKQIIFPFFLLLSKRKKQRKGQANPNAPLDLPRLTHKSHNYWPQHALDLATCSLRNDALLHMMRLRIVHTAGAVFFACRF